MAKVEGLQSVLSALRKRSQEAKKEEDVSVVVGYTAAYAVYVHEDLEARHTNGQAKFLEQPAREQADELARIYREARQRGATHEKAMLLCGLRLQRESQLLVPVDTGVLKNSAFTRLEKV